MNRLEFISSSLALLGVPSLIELFNSQNINRQLLLGKGTPDLTLGETPLLHPTAEALEPMTIAARKEGIEIKVVSGYRSFERQKAIWNRKFLTNEKIGLTPEINIKKIIEYSTLPGTSRHHWGTDIDIIDGNQPRKGDVLVARKFHGNGPYAALRKWMDINAETFGFLQPYTNSPDRKGFYYEPWHYSYAPLAVLFLREYRKIDLIEVFKNSQLLGREQFSKAFLNQYKKNNILGINEKLK